MLDKLPFDVMSRVAQHLPNPKDHYSLFATCKPLNQFIKHHVSEITLDIEYEFPVYFFRLMKGLRILNVFRTYDILLDFKPLFYNTNLQIIFVNAYVNVCSIPKGVEILYGYDTLLSHAPLFLSDDEHSDDEDFRDVNDAIGYFTLRTKFKKYTKVTYKNRSYQMKTRHLASSI